MRQRGLWRGVPVFHRWRNTVFFLWEEGLAGGGLKVKGLQTRRPGRWGKVGSYGRVRLAGGPGNPSPPERGAKIGLLVFENI